MNVIWLLVILCDTLMVVCYDLLLLLVIRLFCFTVPPRHRAVSAFFTQQVLGVERESLEMAAPNPFKKNYRCSQALQQFYSGGPFAVSSDGSFIACTCSDSIKIVDSSNAYIRSTIDCESDTITALCLSPNDKLLFSAGHSRQIRVWDLSTFKCIRSWKVNKLNSRLSTSLPTLPTAGC